MEALNTGKGNLETARQRYQRKLGTATNELVDIRRRQLVMVWTRTMLFFAALLPLMGGYGGGEPRLLWLSVGWLSAAGFLVAIIRHEHLRLRLLELKATERLYRKLLARLDRNWSELPVPKLAVRAHATAMADDLDVFGPGSLSQLILLACTLPGRETIASWLTEWSSWDEIRGRQRAVQALRDLPELREQIVQAIAAVSDGSEEVQALPDWAAGPLWLPRHRMAHLLSWLGPACTVVGLILLGIAVSNGRGMLVQAAGWTVAVGFTINLLVTLIWGSWLHEIFSHINGKYRDIFQFQGVFQALADLPRDGGLLDEIRQAASEGPTCAVVAFRSLAPLMSLANLQRDVLLYFLYLILQLLFLWDFRVLELLERWQLHFGSNARNWFGALGRCEALMCGATLADEYPRWAFPKSVDGTEIILRATELGHPLLTDRQRVTNDVCLTRAKPLLLVTGSNMAGKSTMLRAMGLNQYLARTGSPVCATSLETQEFEVATSIRVRDSLQEGVSFFMAELHRLKQVVDIAETNSATTGRPVLFLLDEILQGTNSRERQIAVVKVIERLQSCGAIGAVSTHDLDLAALPSIERTSQIVHFREFFETVDGTERMRFDYLMRPGPTPTTNALKLLRIVGLDDQ